MNLLNQTVTVRKLDSLITLTKKEIRSLPCSNLYRPEDYLLVGMQFFFTIMICLSISIILGSLANDAKASQTGELVLSDGTKVLLKQEGINNFLDAVDGTYANIKNAISKITISSMDGNAIIMGYSIRFTDGTVYNNIELIGKSGNYYFFRSGTAEFNIKLSDAEANKLNGLKTVSARGEYIGSAEDTLQK